ncbi:hypothetical protein [Oryzifoliimicrobium ureilyticus]|uniref:hypothetical protein n=1 Tax=Oryzifoliimicrobium ureilyticus TaxID=3113724 RepID=UPI00307637F8
MQVTNGAVYDIMNLHGSKEKHRKSNASSSDLLEFEDPTVKANTSSLDPSTTGDTSVDDIGSVGGDANDKPTTGTDAFYELTGYKRIRSAEGVSFVDDNGMAAPEDKMAMLKAASQALSTAEGHPGGPSKDLYASPSISLPSDAGTYISGNKMYDQLMSLIEASVAS